MTEDPSKISNLELVRRCALLPVDQKAWSVFQNRFGEHIKRMVLREGRRKKLRGLDAMFKDLVSDVYLKLVRNDFNALKAFYGNSEESIYLYLAVIARNVVRGEHTRQLAQRRPRIVKSLDEPITQSGEDDRPTVADMIASQDTADAGVIEYARQQEIDRMLDQVVTGRNKERDKLIFKLAVIEEFPSEQIATTCGKGISLKRIENRNKEIKTLLSKRFPGHELQNI